MMMRSLLSVIGVHVVRPFASAAPAWACEQSSGLSVDDKRIARRICQELAENEDIVKVEVRRTTMTMEVSEPYHLGLQADHEQAAELLEAWVNRLKGETGKRMVTVNVKFDGDTVIECKVDQVGNMDLKFLAETES